MFGDIRKRTLIRTGPLYAGDLAEKTLDKSFGFFRLLFTYVEEKLTEQWELGNAEGGFAARNIGVASFIVITWDILEYLRISRNIILERLSYEEIFDLVQPFIVILIGFLDNMSSDDLRNMSKQWGSTGVSKVRREFQRSIHEKHKDFQPDGLLQYIKESSGIYNDETRDNIFTIQEHIKDHIFDQLKQEHGADQWWRLGVPKQIQKDCAVKAIEVDPPEPPENFLLVLDYQKIIKTNWQLLGDYYSPPSIKHGNKDAKLNWFVQFNSIRNRVMHPERQDVTEEEYNFINDIKEWLLPRIS